MKKFLICILVVLTLAMSICASCGKGEKTESQESPDAGWKDEF